MKKEEFLHLSETNKTFSAFLYIIFIVFIATSVTSIVLMGISTKSKVDSSNEVNDIVSILLNSYLLSGNCLQCNAKTNELTFLSKYVENDPLNSNSISTPHFPVNSGNRLIIPNLVVFNNLQFVNNFDLTSTDSSQTTSLYFGNMSKFASPSVTGLPLNSRSTLIINAFNGDIVPQNSRCLSFTNPRIYIVYTYNNMLNITNFNLCLCPPASSLIVQKEYCSQFS